MNDLKFDYFDDPKNQHGMNLAAFNVNLFIYLFYIPMKVCLYLEAIASVGLHMSVCVCVCR